MLPQKVLHLEDALKRKTPKLAGDFMYFEKYNGWYVYSNFSTESGNWSPLFSSNGRVIPSMMWLQGELNKLPAPKEDTRIIMEAILPGAEFEEANGIFNRSVGNCAVPQETMLMAHDIIPLRSYFKVQEENFALNRYKMLQTLDYSSIRRNFQVAPLQGIVPYDKDYWYDRRDYYCDQEKEGVVFKRTTGIYSPGKRTTDMIKLKEEIDLDLVCIRGYETIGEKGFRNINLEFKLEDGTLVTVRLGKDSDVAAFRQNSLNFVGQVCEIHAMKRIKGGGLKEPRFIRRREDKGVL